jgi:hypothetical protein
VRFFWGFASFRRFLLGHPDGPIQSGKKSFTSLCGTCLVACDFQRPARQPNPVSWSFWFSSLSLLYVFAVILRFTLFWQPGRSINRKQQSCLSDENLS